MSKYFVGGYGILPFRNWKVRYIRCYWCRSAKKVVPYCVPYGYKYSHRYPPAPFKVFWRYSTFGEFYYRFALCSPWNAWQLIWHYMAGILRERDHVQVAKMPVTIPADTIQGASKLLADNLNIAVGELRRLFLGTLFLSCLVNHLNQCCGSGSGIVLFWPLDPGTGMEKNRIQDEDPRSYFYLGLKI